MNKCATYVEHTDGCRVRQQIDLSGIDAAGIGVERWPTGDVSVRIGRVEIVLPPQHSLRLAAALLALHQEPDESALPPPRGCPPELPAAVRGLAARAVESVYGSPLDESARELAAELIHAALWAAKVDLSYSGSIDLGPLGLLHDWNPVHPGGRLPEPEHLTDVLIQVPDEEEGLVVTVGFLRRAAGGGLEWLLSDTRELRCEPVAWQPLPEAWADGLPAEENQLEAQRFGGVR
jgi:hypothetical protein